MKLRSIMLFLMLWMASCTFTIEPNKEVSPPEKEMIHSSNDRLATQFVCYYVKISGFNSNKLICGTPYSISLEYKIDGDAPQITVEKLNF